MDTGTNCPTPCDIPTPRQSLQDRIIVLEKQREELTMRVCMLEEGLRAVERFTGMAQPVAPSNRNC